MNQPIIIGIDHGYGNIKTANCCFKTGVEFFEKEPTFKHNLLTYNEKFYTIGGEHKEFVADKVNDEDFYILTLAGIARELNIQKVSSAKVYLAVGLPLTWITEQKDKFRNYLLQFDNVDFTYNGNEYHVDFVGAEVFPQGFSAIATYIKKFSGVNLVADIGNGTMNMMYVNDRLPVRKKCFTEKFGVYQCTLAVRENVMKKHGVTLEDSLIQQVFRQGTADIGEKYLETIQETATEYVDGIFRRLREHEYNPDLMNLYILGGGSCLVKHFGKFDSQRVTIIGDICATAKGYEYLAGEKLKKGKMVV